MPSDFEGYVKEFGRQIGCEDYRQLREVLLDGYLIPALGTLEILREMRNLELLSMNYCGIQSLEEPFPSGLTIQRLDISDSKLSKSDFHKLTPLENLVELNLGGTTITCAADLEPFKNLVKLRIFGILDTQLSRSANYRQDVFSVLPQLHYVDDLDKRGNYLELSDEDEDDDEEEDEAVIDDDEYDEVDDDEDDTDESESNGELE